MRAPTHKWTDEQRDFIKENIKGTPYKAMRDMFNEHFDTSLNLSQIGGFIKRNNFLNGNDAKFLKGEETWNKGMKGLNTGGEAGWFKTGDKPHNYKPVGSERFDKDGYTIIKVQDDGDWPSRWKHKHRIVWEKEHGKIPAGHVVIFGNGDKSNLSLDNLVLIERSQLAMLNKNNLIQGDVELTKTGIAIVDMQLKIGALMKEG